MSGEQKALTDRIEQALSDCVREDGQGFGSVVGQMQHTTVLRGESPPSNLRCVAAYIAIAIEEMT